MREWRKKNAERDKANRDRWKKENPDKVKAMRLRWKQSRTSQYLLYIARKRAKKKGMDFFISAADIPVPKTCPVLGIPLVVGGKNATGFLNQSPTIDRIDNTKGYIPGNVMVVSLRANRIKSDATVGELGKIYKFYKQLKGKK